VPVILLGFGVALAIVIGQRMSTDAMAVVIGVAVGVAASVPTSLLLVALLRRERAEHRPPTGGEWGPYPPQLPPQQPPNVIVVDPTQYAQNRNNNGYPLPPTNGNGGSFNPDGGQRRLRVVGSSDDWGDTR
jgi:hypothetical protein